MAETTRMPGPSGAAPGRGERPDGDGAGARPGSDGSWWDGVNLDAVALDGARTDGLGLGGLGGGFPVANPWPGADAAGGPLGRIRRAARRVDWVRALFRLPLVVARYVVERVGVESAAAALFLGLGSFLGMVALAIPDLVRPGWVPVMIAVTVATLMMAVGALMLAEPPRPLVLAVMFTEDLAILLAAVCLADRAASRLVAALYILPALYAALFLGPAALWVQALVAVLCTGVIMVVAGTVGLVAVANLGVIVTAVVAPVVAVTMLRRGFTAALERERSLATTDPLTGLVNRRGVAAGARQLVRHADRSGLEIGAVVADVDHFKQVNDRHGHAAGDAVLRRVAEAVRACARSDDVVARLGGDEIALLTVGRPRQLAGLAEQVRQEVARCAHNWQVTVSVGVVWTTPTDDREDPLELLWTLLDAADDRMYGAKRAGRNQVGSATDDA